MSKPINVLWVGPLYDMTGYAHASNNSLLALNKVAQAENINLAARPIRLTNQSGPIPKQVVELTTKQYDKYDVVIQHALPPLMSYYGGVKNIGYFHCETTNFESSAWQFPLNLMDQVWVSCSQNMAACLMSDIRPPVKVVSIPLDLDSYDPYGPRLSETFNNHYVFYCIGDWSTRKDMHRVIRAYYSAFSSADEVVLVLKTYIDMHSPEQSKAKISAEIEEIKKQMRLGPAKIYPPIVLICDYLSEEKIHALHRMGDCYVTAERGAAWNIPAAEAIAFGNAVITGDFGGPSEYMENRPSIGLHMIDGTMTPVYGMGHSYDGLYTSKELWSEMNEVDLSHTMQTVRVSGKQKYNREERSHILNGVISLENSGRAMVSHIRDLVND